MSNVTNQTGREIIYWGQASRPVLKQKVDGHTEKFNIKEDGYEGVVHYSGKAVVVLLTGVDGIKGKGVAKCREGDVYVPRNGFRLAYERALAELHTNRAKAFAESL